MAPASQTPNLPQWAQVSSSSAATSNSKERQDAGGGGGGGGGVSTVSLEEEELYLRVRGHRFAVEGLEGALRRCAEERLRPLAGQVREFFARHSGAAPPEPPTGAASSPLCVPAPHCYSPRLLPCAVLNAPCHSSDRKYLVRRFAGLWKQSARRTAVVHIEQSQQQQQQQQQQIVHCGPWMEEIWRQCAHQDSFTTTTPMSRKRKKTNKHWTSHTNFFLQWAASTTKFDSVSIILDDTSKSLLLPDFMDLLARLRREYGLSLQLILVDSSSSLSSSRGTHHVRHCEVAVESFQMPTSQQVCDALWRECLVPPRDHDATQKTLSPLFIIILLSPRTLHAIHSSIQQYSQSFVKTLALLKQGLAWQWQRRGSLLRALPALTGHADFLSAEGRRLAWFCCHGAARSAATERQPSAAREQLAEIPCRRIREARVAASLLEALHGIGGAESASSLHRIVHALQELPLMQAMAKHFAQAVLRPMQLQRVFLRLQRVRTALMMMMPPRTAQAITSQQRLFCKWIGVSVREDELSSDNPLQGRVDAVNEFIILLDKATDRETLDFLWDSIQDWVLELFQQLSQAWQSLLPACDDPGDDEAMASILLPQHRRDVAAAIVGGSSSSSSHGFGAATTLWNLISDLVAIPRDEWFRLARKQRAWRDVDEREAWWLFSLGVHELQFVGLIRPRRRGNRELVYEKAALVWSTASAE